MKAKHNVAIQRSFCFIPLYFLKLTSIYTFKNLALLIGKMIAATKARQFMIGFTK